MEKERSMQERALHAYCVLLLRRSSWHRRLLLLAGSNAARPYAYAGLAAGGCVLWVDDCAAQLSQANKELLTDFTVDSLSEALRILKNEIRQGRSVSVGLNRNLAAALGESALRGVQPDAILAAAQEAVILVARGAERLPELPAGEAIAWDAADHWRSRQAQDAALLHAFAASNRETAAVANRWIGAAARLFPRDLQRCWAARWSPALPNDSEDGR